MKITFCSSTKTSFNVLCRIYTVPHCRCALTEESRLVVEAFQRNSTGTSRTSKVCHAASQPNGAQPVVDTITARSEESAAPHVNVLEHLHMQGMYMYDDASMFNTQYTQGSTPPVSVVNQCIAGALCHGRDHGTGDRSACPTLIVEKLL